MTGSRVFTSGAAASSWLLGGERGTGQPSSWSTLLLSGKQSSRWLSGCFMPVVVQRQVLGWVSAELDSLIVRQSTAASGRISCISCTRSPHLESWCVYFLLSSYLAVIGVGVWVLLAEYRELDFSGDVAFFLGATLDSTVNTCSASSRDAFGRNSHISSLTWTRILRCFFVLTQNGELCSVDASGALKSGTSCTSCTWQAACTMKGRG